MKFRSPTALPVYLALTSGHTFVVGPELAEVPQRFHRMAVSEGCLPEGMAAMPGEDGTTAPDKPALIIKAIEAMKAENKDGDFLGDGKPNLGRLSVRAGFNVSRIERDAAWDTLAAADED